LGDEDGISWCLNAIGVFYSIQGDLEKALRYYIKGLEMNEISGDQISISYSLRNIGGTYFRLGEDEKALEFYERSLQIDEELNDKRSMASSLSSIGHLHAKHDELDLAMEYFQRSLRLSKEIGNRDMECEDLQNIGWLHSEQGNHMLGISECNKSYDIALEIGSVEDQLEACECLYEAYKALGKNANALAFHEKMMVLQDSLDSESIAKTLQQMEFQNVMMQDSLIKAEEARLIEEAHKEEMRQEEKTRNISIAIGVFVLLLAAGLYTRLRYIRKSKAIIEKERDRSDNLLLNILPEEIAEELKENGKAIARDFDMVSILFTDFKGFTQVSATLSAQELVAEINTCFEAFDGIMGKNGIEKIKTIGDAYMAAGGLPVPTMDSLRNTVLAALEMQEFIIKHKAKKDALNQAAFEMRCGIHTGPVVAGIVGVKKFQYDVWGDTVNTASRMESNGETGKVNISQATYELLKMDPQFRFESRGKLKVKGKGEIEMWFVSKY
jgi:class 3 adenylate cyclase